MKSTNNTDSTVSLSLVFFFFSLFFLPVSLKHLGGSYKKIGYYDSSQKNLSWFGNDVWIGKMEFTTLSSSSFLCLHLSVLNAVSHQSHRCALTLDLLGVAEFRLSYCLNEI